MLYIYIIKYQARIFKNYLMKIPVSPDPYTWKKEYELHNELYDKQARKFLDIINQMKKIIAGGVEDKDISAIFFQLTHYYEQFMIREEINMKERGYNKFESHKGSHKEFIDHIMAFREGYEKGDKDVYYEMFNYLENWFDEHMMVDDRKAVGYISGSKG